MLSPQDKNKPLRVSLDAMGGDFGPEVTVAGAALAVSKNPRIIPILVGDEKVIKELITKHPNLTKAEIVHSDDVVPAGEKPSVALRTGRNSSMKQALDLVKDGKADAAVSSGNTGALMAMALVTLRTLKGIDRPALASYLPTISGQCCMLDLGANVECDAANLVQFAMMGDAFYRDTLDVQSPTIGLLNIGEEEQKGNAALRDAAAILSNPENGLNYSGFIEGDDITKGSVDIVVSDGFSGNIALKTAEGTAHFVTTLLRRSIKSSLLAKIGLPFVYFALRALRKKLDPQQYNGAVLLGLNGIVVKSHGNATPQGIAKAIAIAVEMIDHEFMTDLKSSIQRSIKAVGDAEQSSQENGS
jgi:glycerol-3-phosphate acyltransferase PlsX